MESSTRSEGSPPDYGAVRSAPSRLPTRRHSTLSAKAAGSPQPFRRASLITLIKSRVSEMSTSILSLPSPPTTPPQSPVTRQEAEVQKVIDAYASPLNILLIATFAGLIAHAFGSADVVVFALNFIGMLPLAMLLGKATEDIADHTNETIGALVNVTFGNAVELIISISALRAGKLQLIQDTISGSILSNLLLVLGSAFFFGGLAYKEQVVLPAVCEANADLLSFAVFGFSVPALFSTAVPTAHRGATSVDWFSLLTSICLLSIYAMYMWFQLVTHADWYTDGREDGSVDAQTEGDVEQAENEGAAVPEAVISTDSRPLPSLQAAICILAVNIMLVITSSEILVSSLDGFSAHIGLSKKFIAVILLPVIGNAVEHMSAIFVARHNKIDLSIGIACGSSLQIALFAAPLLVVISWIFEYEHLTLNFELFETICIGFTVLVVNATMRDSRTNWLEGAVLIVCYFILAIAFFFME